MNDLSLDELYILYQDTIQKCGTYLLHESDEIIEYNIFEDFDIGVVSFLHRDNLQKLVKGNFISNSKMNESDKLRKLVFELQNNGEWNMYSLKNSINWKNVLELADKINLLK